ncbi:MAG: DUF2069 domain-containing protein [Candidatus Competibacteraceae bacterium]|nr:DUF2069 domain-containing protein [Candidatus Competibacteraceae bacterium]
MALSGYFGLFGLLLLWFGWLEPVSGLPVSVVVVLLVGPLLFPLRGLLHGRFYTHAWASFLALFYFSAGVFSLAGAMRRPWLAWLEIAFSLLWFLGAILYVRTGARERRRLGKAVEASIVANGARPTEDTARRRLEK